MWVKFVVVAMDFTHWCLKGYRIGASEANPVKRESEAFSDALA
jgi:hypothetical protein